MLKSNREKKTWVFTTNICVYIYIFFFLPEVGTFFSVKMAKFRGWKRYQAKHHRPASAPAAGGHGGRTCLEGTSAEGKVAEFSAPHFQ